MEDKYLILLIIILLIISIVDFKEYIIPDSLVLIGIFINILFNFNKDRLLFSFIISLCLFLLVILFNKIKKQEMMGMGDIKLLFMLCLYLDKIACLKAIILACIIGIIFMTIKKSKMIPFGPCLSIAFIILILLKSLNIIV